jgi:hypothetical protein
VKTNKTPAVATFRAARQVLMRYAMMLSRLATFGVALLVSTSLGCVFSPAPSDETSSSEAAAMTESFRLSDDLESTGGKCDIHVVLTLSSPRAGEVKEPFGGGAVLNAHLHNEVYGDCKLRLDPDPRDYALIFDGEECGSAVYKASVTRAGDPREMTLTDHRSRLCKDYKPAKLVVEEASREGEIRTLSSVNGAPLRPVS